VSRRLAERGAVVIDADAVAREVVEPGSPGLAAVVEAFGSDVLKPDSSLDRPRLAEIVFADPASREKLNAIIHPLVGERMRDLGRGAAPDAIVVQDVPLLAENGLAHGYDAVIVVDVPPQLQVERLVRERGMSQGQARDRMAAQASREQRLAVADIVIDNSGPLADLDKRIDEVWAELGKLATPK
jgi:dephospho-CoA kinase